MSWLNIKKLWDLAGIANISYLLSADLKFSLTALGLQTATSMYPCPYCFISSRQLRGVDAAVAVQGASDETSHGGKLTSEDIFQTTFKEKTFGDLAHDFKSFQDMGASRAHHAQLCLSTVNPSVLQEGDDIRVLDKVPFPELHVMEGILNYGQSYGVGT